MQETAQEEPAQYRKEAVLEEAEESEPVPETVPQLAQEEAPEAPPQPKKRGRPAGSRNRPKEPREEPPRRRVAETQTPRINENAPTIDSIDYGLLSQALASHWENERRGVRMARESQWDAFFH